MATFSMLVVGITAALGFMALGLGSFVLAFPPRPLSRPARKDKAEAGRPPSDIALVTQLTRPS